MPLPTKRHPRRDAVPADYDGSTALPNARWELFCQNYTGEKYRCNASASYRAAGYRCEGDRSDTSAALRMLANVFIQKRIDHLNARRMEQLRKYECAAKERLVIIALARDSDYRDENGRIDLAKVHDPRLSQAVEYCRPMYDREGNFVDFELKLLPHLKAMEMLGWSDEKREQMQNSNNTLIINA